MHQIRQDAEHIANAGHVYCRLRELGFSKNRAIYILRIYGFLINHILYKHENNNKEN